MKKPVKNDKPTISNPAESRELSAEELAQASGGDGFDLSGSQSGGFDLSGQSTGTVSFPTLPAFELGNNYIGITFPK
jgi:hypothetical protein